ncbi:hypothetical protein [Paenibacillus naphthalenovorans]|uniref:hypothetical protein n=1 Tax=Paenibacillus naphthalenovorans TaxID=162209 RepID=UPI003D2B19C7
MLIQEKESSMRRITRINLLQLATITKSARVRKICMNQLFGRKKKTAAGLGD